MSKITKLLSVSAAALLIAGCGSSDNDTATGAGTTTTASTSSSAFESASNFPSGSCVLWKPTSEIDHGLVVLIPAAFKAPSVPVQVLRPNGEVFATGREHTQARGHNICNGTRLHYVFGKGPGSAYPMNSVLAYGSNRYKIPNPAGRYE